MRKEALQGLLSGNYLNVSTARQRCLALTHLRLTVFNLFEKIIKKKFQRYYSIFFYIQELELLAFISKKYLLIYLGNFWWHDFLKMGQILGFRKI